MIRKPRPVRAFSAVIGLSTALLAYCGNGTPLEPLDVRGVPGRQVIATVGQEIRITLQSIGPGRFASPPALTGSAVAFLESAIVPPHVPAGVTQEFRFRAATRGQAVIAFHHTGITSAVTDTVIVQ